MKLRTSYYNSAIFKSNARRFWWVSALYTIAIFVSCVLPLYIDNHDREMFYQGMQTEMYRSSFLLGQSVFAYLFIAVFSVGLAVLLFSYLNSKSAVAEIHSVPVKRKTLFVTHALFGIASLIVPIVLNGIILLFMRSNPSVAHIMSIEHIVAWGYTQIAYSLVAFSFTILIQMFVANSVAGLIFPFIFAFLPYLAELATRGLMTVHLYGYSNYLNASGFLTSKFLYFGIERISNPLYTCLYIAYALVFLALAYLVYRKRGLENTQEVVAFPKLKNFFVYGVGICTGLCGYFYLMAIAEVTSLLWIIPFGALGLVIANMLTKKAFTIRGIFAPSLAFILSLVVLFAFLHFDITGFETKVPDSKKIKSASVTTCPLDQFGQGRMVANEAIVPQSVYIPYLTDKKDIENIVKYHKFKTESSEKDVAKATLYNNTDSIYINYTLENGKTLSRVYNANLIEEKDYLKPIMETDEYLEHKFPVLGEGEKYVSTLVVTDARLNGTFNAYYKDRSEDKEMMQKLLTALKKDLENVKYEEFAYNSPAPTAFEIEATIPYVYMGTDVLYVPDDDYKYALTEGFTYYIRPSYKNTIKVLEELGFYDVIPSSAYYKEVHITNTSYLYKEDSPEAQVITDPAIIDEIYNYVIVTPANLYALRTYDEGLEFSVNFKSESGANYSVTRTSKDEDLPQVLKELFN